MSGIERKIMLTRKLFLKGLGLSPLAVRGWAQAPAITVAGLQVFRIKVNRLGNWILVRLETTAGLSGLGDASHGASDERTISMVERYFQRLKGRSVYDVEWLRQELFPEVEKGGRSAATAFGALEQCLWDIQGKALGMPTYQLFGGRLRTAIRNYANINRSTEPRDPAGFARNARAAIEAGFDAIKLAPFDGMPRGDDAAIEQHVRRAIDCLTAVRDAIGPSRDLLVDVHNTLNLERGLKLAGSLEPLNLFWLEEVTPKLEDLATLNRISKTATAGGESIFGVKGFYPYIAAGAVDTTMPDIKYCGGMLEMKKIAVLSEAASLQVSPHGPASPVGNAAAAQVSATLPNFLILEHSFGEVPWRSELIDPPEVLENGRMNLSSRPGFGISLNEKTARKYAV